MNPLSGGTGRRSHSSIDSRATVARHLCLSGLVFAACLAVASYFFGLDSQHIPKNGDEYAYEHITRLTAASGALLPLRSDIAALRNTKPPLVFWQGIATTDGGRDWTLLRLRWPSVLYTMATAGLVFAVGLRVAGRAETGWTALLSFLAFYSTYRYGRAFLTNAPETFWLFLPFASLLIWPAAARSRLLVPLLSGVAIGLALLYKSFALVLPAGLALGWWSLRDGGSGLRSFLAKDAWKLVLTLSIALATFASWFLLDPDPAGVFRDFVVRENAGKFDLPGGYLPRLLWGASSLWSLALAYPANAGLLAFPVVALFVCAWRRRAQLGEAEKRLFILVTVFLLVFAVPSQRSGRYLLPAMPALALLLALAWERVARWAFLLSLAAAAVVFAGVGVLWLRLVRSIPGFPPTPPAPWAVLGLGAAVVIAGLASPVLTRPLALVAVFLAYLAVALLLRPFDGPAGRYDLHARESARGREVAVPYDFVAKEERYRFLLPGADVVGYRQGPDVSVAELVRRYPLVVIQVPLQAADCTGCVVLGRRLDLRGRQTAAELREVLHGRLSPALVVEERLVERAR